MQTAEEVVEIRVMLKQGKSIREIARELGVSRNTVRRYARGAAPGYKARPPVARKLAPMRSGWRNGCGGQRRSCACRCAISRGASDGSVVPADRRAHGITKIAQEMSAVGDMDRTRRALAGAFGTRRPDREQSPPPQGARAAMRRNWRRPDPAAGPPRRHARGRPGWSRSDGPCATPTRPLPSTRGAGASTRGALVESRRRVSAETGIARRWTSRPGRAQYGSECRRGARSGGRRIARSQAGTPKN